MRAQFSNGLHVSSSAHEIIDVAVVLVDVFKDIDASAVRIYRELELDLVAGVVHDTLSKLLGVLLEGAGLVFHDRNSILYSIEDGMPALIAQIDVGLVCEGVQEPTRQVRDIDGDGAGEQVEGRMTSTVPDGIQLCGSDNAVAELDIHTLGAHISLIIVLQGVTTGHCTSLSSGCVEQTDLNGNRDIVTIVVHAQMMRPGHSLVALEDRLDENIASLAVRHLIVGNQDTGGSGTGIIGLEVVAILDAEMLRNGTAQHIEAGNLARSAAAILGQHSACGALVHLHIDDGGGSAERLVGITHDDVGKRDILLFNNLHLGVEGAVNEVVGILFRLLGGDEPRILVPGSDQQEVVETYAVDAQRTLIGVTRAKLQAFAHLVDVHTVAPVGSNHAD